MSAIQTLGLQAPARAAVSAQVNPTCQGCALGIRWLQPMGADPRWDGIFWNGSWYCGLQCMKPGVKTAYFAAQKAEREHAEAEMQRKAQAEQTAKVTKLRASVELLESAAGKELCERLSAPYGLLLEHARQLLFAIEHRTSLPKLGFQTASGVVMVNPRAGKSILT
jgi:hypothetical protein